MCRSARAMALAQWLRVPPVSLHAVLHAALSSTVSSAIVCHHQTSLIAGTLFEYTKLPLTRWFLAMYLLTQTKNGVLALELSSPARAVLQQRLADETQAHAGDEGA